MVGEVNARKKLPQTGKALLIQNSGGEDHQDGRDGYMSSILRMATILLSILPVSTGGTAAIGQSLAQTLIYIQQTPTAREILQL